MSVRYEYNTEIFKTDNALAYYLLGACMTDGCIHTCSNYKYITFDSNELDWITEIQKIISPNRPIRKERTAYRLNVNNVEITNWFINKGCTPRKSLTLEYPKIPDKYLPDFLRGCWDGDGCIGTYMNTTVNKKGVIYKYPKPQSYLCSSSVNFIKPIYDELISIGYGANFQHKKCKNQSSFFATENRHITHTSDQYLIRFSTKKCAEFLEWIYYPNHQLSNPRKYNKAKEIINYYK